MEEVSVQWWGERPGERAPPAGWLRTAWNFCWEWGLQRPFPHRAGELDVLRRAVRAYLAEREAPGYKLEALADWSADKYVARRSFEERRPSFAESRRRLGRPPLRPRPFWLVPELPPMMREPDAGGRFRPLVQFAKDWAVRPACRGRMMADPPRRKPSRTWRPASRRWCTPSATWMKQPLRNGCSPTGFPSRGGYGVCGRSIGTPASAACFCGRPPRPAPTTTFSSPNR